MRRSLRHHDSRRQERNPIETSSSTIGLGSPRVALLLVSVSDLSGSGGTERHFADLYEHLRRHRFARIDLITSTSGVIRLRETGRLQAADDVIALPLGKRPARGKLGVAWLTALLLWETVRYRWDVIHVCQPIPAYVPFCAAVSWLPRSCRPRVAITVVDCTLAHHLRAERPATDPYEQQVVAAHRMYFNWTQLDGVYSWYREFVQAARALRLLPSATLVAARYCFTDTARFIPAAKTPTVVYAGRFSNQKRPLLFVDAVASLLRRHPRLADGWRFEMYGGGPLETSVRERIRELGLERRVAMARTPDMAPIFAASKLFVSTQALENFTSLAMLEAMAAGNAVVAEDAGQTCQFVTHGANGLLVPVATPDAVGDAIADYIAHPEWHERMAAASRRLATEVHTVEHFAGDILDFWRRLVAT